MTQPHSMAQQIGQTAINFQEQRLGRKLTLVTVLLDGDTLEIMMQGVLSQAEQALAETQSGTATLQDIHQQLFQRFSDPLKQEIKRITGFEVCEADDDTTTAAVSVLSNGTVVQVFALAGHLSADSWIGT